MTVSAGATATEGRRAAHARQLVVSAWSAVSPFGVGGAALREGMAAGRSAITELSEMDEPVPFRRAGLIPDFVAAEQLGRKGTRSMDRVTAIAVKVVGELLERCGPDLTEDSARLGLTLGTGSGSAQSIMDFTKVSLTKTKPFHVDPARFPNTVMNRAAGQSAIWYGIRGPNTTIAGGSLTGLLALSSGVRLVRGGHCDRVVFGAAEECTPQRSWLEWSAAEGDRGADWALGEGGAVFLLESADSARDAGRRPLARVLGTRFRAFAGPADAGSALAECVRDNLRAAGVSASEVGLVAPLGDLGAWGEQERAALDEVVGDVRRTEPRALIGDTSAAATSMQMAAVLAEAPARTPGLALITGVERDGTVGSVLLEMGGA